MVLQTLAQSHFPSISFPLQLPPCCCSSCREGRAGSWCCFCPVSGQVGDTGCLLHWWSVASCLSKSIVGSKAGEGKKWRQGSRICYCYLFFFPPNWYNKACILVSEQRALLSLMFSIDMWPCALFSVFHMAKQFCLENENRGCPIWIKTQTETFLLFRKQENHLKIPSQRAMEMAYPQFISISISSVRWSEESQLVYLNFPLMEGLMMKNIQEKVFEITSCLGLSVK